MKFFLLAFCSLFFSVTNAQVVLYAASKSGLSLREQPMPNSKVIQKIAYGQKLQVLQDTIEPVKISTEGFNGYWQKIKYNNQVGYVVSSYLLPMAPPKPAVKTIKDYLTQISVAAGPVVTVKNGSMQTIEEGGTVLKKQLFKNGAEYHELLAYEYNAVSFFIPELTVEQAFLLVRLTGAYSTEVTEKDEFPVKNSKSTLANGTKTITVKKVDWGNGKEGAVEKITIDTEEGPISTLEIFLLNGQAVISWSSGV